MTSIDADIVIWLNGLSGNIAAFDNLMRIAASDYMMPLVFSLSMLGLWFSGNNPAQRIRYQLTTLMGISALSIANILVLLP